MDARIVELPFDTSTLKGLSEKLLRSHHQNNYSGAVKRLNAIRTQLREAPFASTPGFHLNGLRREELIATNSMLLHELYFDEQASDAFGAAQEEAAGAVLLDVRRSAVFDQSNIVIPGAQWRDPGDIDTWAGQLPHDRDVVVYCVYGHEVGRVTAMRLCAAGIRARYLRGGIDAWKAASKPLQSKGGAS